MWKIKGENRQYNTICCRFGQIEVIKKRKQNSDRCSEHWKQFCTCISLVDKPANEWTWCACMHEWLTSNCNTSMQANTCKLNCYLILVTWLHDHRNCDGKMGKKIKFRKIVRNVISKRKVWSTCILTKIFFALSFKSSL